MDRSIKTERERSNHRRRSPSRERSRERSSRSSKRRSSSRDRDSRRRSRSRSPTRRHSKSSYKHRDSKTSYDHENDKHHNSRSSSTVKREEVKPESHSSTPSSHHSSNSRSHHDDANIKHESASVTTKHESTSVTNSQSIVKEQPNYNMSGLLAHDALQHSNDNVLKSDKYAEPADASVPSAKYRLYCFKDGKQQDEPMKLTAGLSCYMIGRDDRLCYITLHHPSISSQHAVIQFKRKWQAAPFASNVADAIPTSTIVPYLIDLASTNGTELNHRPIESQRYIELRHKDVLKFGQSGREYVLISDNA